MTHTCPLCTQPTEGSWSEGGAKWALCEACVAYYPYSLRKPKRTVTCDYCGQTMEDDPGAYYHQKACEASHWRKKIKALGKRTCECYEDDCPVCTMWRTLQHRLEMAEYVGD